MKRESLSEGERGRRRRRGVVMTGLGSCGAGAGGDDMVGGMLVEWKGDVVCNMHCERIR